MVDKEKIQEKAQNILGKAEILMENDNYKKSAEFFKKSAEMFEQLEEWKIVEKCYFYAAKNYHTLGSEKDFHRASVVERKAGNVSLRMYEFQKARDYFDVAAKSIMKSNAKDIDDRVVTNISFAFFCYLLRGMLDEGVIYIKRFRDKIDPEILANHELMYIVRNLTKAIINKKEQYITDIIDHIPIHYSKEETYLIKESFILTIVRLHLNYSLEMQIKEFEQEKVIEINSIIDVSQINYFKKFKNLKRDFTSIGIIGAEINIGDNISTKAKPDLPLLVDIDNPDKTILPFKFRSNFPGSGFIGPISLTIEIDGIYRFLLESAKEEIKITSPDAVLGIELRPLKTPVINQTFQVEVIVSNKSDGPAMEIEIEFEMPEDIRLMRGTEKKNIYSLSPNENIKWEIMVKAFEIGEIPIKAIVSFKDGDGNKKGPFNAEIPLTINM